MAQLGKFIAIEGIDGSGKRTQLELLVLALESRDLPSAQFSFPRYESSFGKLVARYLNGEFGPLSAVDAHLSALLYAGDRFESKEEIEAALNAGKTVIADRYVGSNLAHQAARVDAAQREEFIAWLSKLEYGLYGLPVEDLVLYLRLPVSEAHRLVGLKKERDYTKRRRDIQEADARHLEQAALVYDRLAKEPNWATIECADAGGGLHSPETVHLAIITAIESRLPALLSASKGAR
jgi:dTMP kinase